MKIQMMNKSNIKSIFKQITALLISICIIGQGSSAYAMQTPKQQRQEFIDYLKEEQDRYKTLFDQEALLEALDYDTDNIIDFVSNKVVYQAYDGVLRGAKGTLIGRAGNSHDQAITLAGMLNDAGLEAEILVGKLTADQATELNLTIASPKFNELKDTISLSKSIVAKKISAKAKELEKTEGENITSLMKKTDALAEKIFQQISKEQLNKGMEAFKQSVQSSAVSYRWVRYRLAQGKKWNEVHPAYVGAKKWNLTPESSEKSSVNSDDLQQVSVEVWIENSAGEKNSVSGLWKRPAANLLDHTLSVEIASDAMLKSNLLSKPEEMIEQSHFFFVKIDGNLPTEGKVFDLNGNIYSGNSLSGLNSVFSTLNKQTQKATDTLSSLSFSNKPEVNIKKQLTKVWLEFTLDKPNTESRKIKRIIFDGESLSETSKTTRRLLQRWDIDVATTTPMQQFYQNKKSEQAIAALEGVEKFQKYLKNKPNAKEEEVIDKYIAIIGNPNEGLLAQKRSIFDRFKYQDDIVSYLNEPHILAVRRGVNHSDDGFSIYEMTDIIANKRLSIIRNETTLLPSLVSGIKHGVWETRTEDARILKEKNTIYVGSAFEKLEQSNEYREHLSDQAMSLYDESNSAWWDVDLSTGSTIGMADLGSGAGGASVTEYIVNLILLSPISMYFAATGTQQCMQGGGGFECCATTNLMLMGVGMALGIAIGSVFMLGVTAGVATGLGIDALFSKIPMKCGDSG